MSVRRSIGMALIAALVIGAPLRAADRGAAQAALTRGMAALDRGDPRAARVELMNAIKADPRYAPAHMAQARVLLELGEGASAIDEIAQARRLGVRAGPGRAMMAQGLLLKGDAIAALKEAGADDVPADGKAQAAHMAARALAMLGRNEEAGAAFDTALALAPRDAALWIDIATFRQGIGDEAGALAAGDRAMAVAPWDPDALVLRGTLVRAQYGLAASLSWFERALEVRPDHVPALIEYAATLGDMGQAGRMLAMTRRVLALDPGNGRAWFLQAAMAARAGDYGLARAMMQHANGSMDAVPAAMLLNGLLLLQGESPLLAVEKLKPLVALQPYNEKARLLLARAYRAAGDQRSAAITLGPLVGRPDAGSYALTLGARVAEALGNRQAIVEFLDRASKPDAGAPVAFDQIGDRPAGNPDIPEIRALLRAGRAGDALPRAMALRHGNPGASAAYVALGDVLGAMGRNAEAARTYAQAANIRFSRDIAMRLVVVLRRSGDPAGATRTLNLFLAQNPADVDANRLAATLQMEAGQWGEAIERLEGLRARLGNGDSQLMADLAWAYLGGGDAASALPFAAHARRLQPMNPAAADIFGWALFKARGRSQAATDLLEQASAMAPGHRLIATHLAQAQGRPERLASR